jgi:hypothetical protein
LGFNLLTVLMVVFEFAFPDKTKLTVFITSESFGRVKQILTLWL